MSKLMHYPSNTRGTEINLPWGNMVLEWRVIHSNLRLRPGFQKSKRFRVKLLCFEPLVTQL